MSCWNSFCKSRHKCGISNTFLFIVFNSPYYVIEHRHEDISSLELFGFAFFVHELLDFVDELQCSESWEIFHSNSIGSPSIVSKVLYCAESLNHVNLSSQTVFDCGFSFIFPRHNAESEKYVNLRVRETDDFFTTNQR